jgi:signal transduction histidine kinase
MLLGLLFVTFILLAGMVFRNLAHFDTVRSYVDYSHRILLVTLDLQEMLSEYLDIKSSSLDSWKVKRVSEELERLARSNYYAQTDTPKLLLKTRDLILDTSDKQHTLQERESILLEALQLTGYMLDAETQERDKQLKEITHDIINEIALAGAIVILVLILIIAFVQRRILFPLQDLRVLLSNLAREDFTPIETGDIDPLLLPIFSSYNEMVLHLAELEESKRHYAESLEGEVRSATRAMLEQQASLAQAEKMAVMGEMAARIAHELRNPLAGIQMCCINIRNETRDSDIQARLEMVVAELKRMGRLLSELLERGKHEPIRATVCDLAQLIEEMAALTRYQISPLIRLEVTLEKKLMARVPESQFKQTLLNLILNAAYAIGPGEGTITLQAARLDQQVSLIVSDTGTGFSPEFLEKEIRPFFTGKPGGTGLGLAMVKRFAYDMGGTLTLENRLPHGARVILTLPALVSGQVSESSSVRASR